MHGLSDRKQSTHIRTLPVRYSLRMPGVSHGEGGACTHDACHRGVVATTVRQFCMRRCGLRGINYTFLRQQVGALSPLPAYEDTRTVAHLHTHPSLRTLHVAYSRRIFQGALDS